MPNTLKSFFLLFFIAVPPFSSFAQLSKGNFNITSTIGYGFIIRHSNRMGQIASTHFNLYEISLRKITNGNREWHAPYHYPEFGIDVGFFPFKNPILGNGAFAIPFIEKKLAKSVKSSLNFKIGYGLSYVSNPYNPENNFQNVAISTHVGYALRGEISYSYKISSYLKIRTVVMLTHFSNASFTQPNAGLNIPIIGVGVSYQPNAKKFSIIPDTFSHAYEKKLKFNIIAAATVKEVGLPGGKKYWGFNMISYLNRRINRKSALNIGLDLFINSAQKHFIETDTTLGGRKPDFKQAAITIGHELFINKLSLVTQFGSYFYSPYPNLKPFYQRYFLKYQINKHFFAGVSLKCHFGTAEYVEVVTGIKL